MFSIAKKIQTRMGVSHKVSFVISVFIILFSLALCYIFQVSTNQALQSEFNDKGMLLAQNLAYNAKLGLIMEDRESLDELIRGVMLQRDVEYALIYDTQGNIFSSSGDSIAWSSRANIGKNLVSAAVHPVNGSLVEFIAPVRYEENTRGYILLGLSLKSLQQKIASTNQKAIWMTMFFVIAGVLLVGLTIRHILRDLGKIKEFAGQLAMGEHGAHVKLRRKDEIGELAESLNLMSDQIKKSLARAEENFARAQETAEIIEKNHEQALFEKKQLENWVSEILHILDTIKTGDLTAKVVTQMDGEIARVASGINLMIAE
ncbi:MAG: HAMP domain-containing protein, partial [Calditrichaeota bacterium]